MSNTVRNLTPFKTFSSSGGATAVSFGIGKLDDASSITIFMASSFSGVTSGGNLQIAQFDPFDPIPPAGTAESTNWYNYTTGTVLTSAGSAMTVTNISFKGIRFAGITTTSSAAGEIIAFASKQISV